jgi:hypothetical protein
LNYTRGRWRRGQAAKIYFEFILAVRARPGGAHPVRDPRRETPQ